jgi:hypothetical protein
LAKLYLPSFTYQILFAKYSAAFDLAYRACT